MYCTNIVDYCEVDSGNNIISCNVALFIRTHCFSVSSSGIDGMYPPALRKNGRLSNTSSRPLDTAASQMVQATR